MLRSVLIVDDDEADRYLLRRLLKRANLTSKIFEAAHGQEALDFFGQGVTSAEFFPPALVFLDINMPKLNGFEFLEAFAPLRRESGLESVVFMMFTSSHLESERTAALAYEFVKGYITKMPKSSEDLVAKLAELKLV